MGENVHIRGSVPSLARAMLNLLGGRIQARHCCALTGRSKCMLVPLSPLVSTILPNLQPGDATLSLNPQLQRPLATRMLLFLPRMPHILALLLPPLPPPVPNPILTLPSLPYPEAKKSHKQSCQERLPHRLCPLLLKGPRAPIWRHRLQGLAGRQAIRYMFRSINVSVLLSIHERSLYDYYAQQDSPTYGRSPGWSSYVLLAILVSDSQHQVSG